MTKRIAVFFFVALFILLSDFPALIRGQDLPDVAQGIQPYISYQGGNVDKVNLATGAVNVRIPLFSFPQRGSLSLSYSIVFNSLSYVSIQSCAGKSCTAQTYVVPTSWNRSATTPMGAQLVLDQEVLAGGISQDDPNYSNPTVIGARYYVTTSDGAQHPLGHTSSGVFRSVDGAGLMFQPKNPSEYPAFNGLPVAPSSTGLSTLPGGQGGTVTDSRGIAYVTSPTGMSTMADPDGNAITVTGYNGEVADSIGRSIPKTEESVSTSYCPALSNAQYQSLASAEEWDVPTFGGGTARYIFCYATVNISTNLGLPLPGGLNKQMKKSFTFLQSVVLPNGQYWGFIYDSANPNNSQSYAYGHLSTLIYPTGGSVNYTNFEGGGSPCDSYRNRGLGGGMSLITYNWFATQREEFDGEGNSSTWMYTFGSPGSVNGSVLSPANDITATEFATADGCGFIDAGEKVYKGSSESGTPLKNRSVPYTFPTVPGFPLAYASYPQAETTVWQGTNSATVSNTYDNALQIAETECSTASTCGTYYTGQIPVGKIVSRSYTDFTASTLKTENTTYQWQANSNYFNTNLLDIPSQTLILNASGTTIASTSYTYDETAYSPGGARGHPTTVSKWLNTGSSPTTHTGWNSMGMKSFFIDAKGNANGNGHSIDYGYSNTLAGCYGSVVTSTTNALNQQTSGVYDYNTGLLQSYADLNSQTTTFNFDSLRRLRCVEYPDGGSTAFNITDTVGSLTVDRVVRSNGGDACASNTNNIDTQDAFDGLGRQIHTRLESDPSGTVYTDTTYDNMGRVASVSNPYRSTSDPTYGVTYSSYDALSRIVKQTDADGSIQYGCYDNYNGYGQTNCHALLGTVAGESVDRSDEVGNDWQNVSDSLGRPTRVIEPNGSSMSPSMETDYGYDGLNNLLSVTQWGGPSGSPNARARSFTYDSLSRLLTAQNPETATMTYTYDANSNLQTKTDARGIQVNYGSYDKLNRSLGKTYSNGDPSVTFTYDASGSGNYGVGHRSGMTDGSGSTTWIYDQMGRISSESRTISGINKTISTTYNPGGAAWKITYPSNSVVEYKYDNAGRVISVTDDTHSISYASSALYAPQGGLTSMSIGSAGISYSNQYNSRLQPSVISATGTPGTIISLSFNYHVGSEDSGNLYSISNNKNNARNQTFTYDTLNRVLQATSGTTWGTAFVYDPWGNLYLTNTVSGTGMNPMSVNQVMNTKNQFTVLDYGYDAAGNVTSDGTNTTGCSTGGYAWNAEEMQSCAVGTTYTYDGDDKRVKKSSGTMYWGGEEGHALAESDLSGNLTSEYIFTSTKRLARRDVSSGNVYYLFSDHLGSSNVITDASGNIQNESDFYPFGGERQITNSLSNHYKFTGKERDQESGNDYFGARYYASSVGRWLSPDMDMTLRRIVPTPQRWNRYAYVINNPLVLFDPNGLADFYVFLNYLSMPDSQETIQWLNKNNLSPDWSAIAKQAEAYGNHVHYFSFGLASPDALQAAADQGQITMIVGHAHVTDIGMGPHADGIIMGDGLVVGNDALLKQEMAVGGIWPSSITANGGTFAFMGCDTSTTLSVFPGADEVIGTIGTVTQASTILASAALLRNLVTNSGAPAALNAANGLINSYSNTSSAVIMTPGQMPEVELDTSLDNYQIEPEE